MTSPAPSDDDKLTTIGLAFGMPHFPDGEWHVGPVTIEGEVAEFLRMRIRSGELRAGDRLPPQRELATILGVARPTLRQALKTLETQGYVVTTRGAAGGTTVAELGRDPRWLPTEQKSVEELDSQFEFRTAIERATSRLASSKRTTAHLDEMYDAIEAMRTESDGSAELRHADARFHLTLAIATGNSRLVDALRAIRSELFLPSEAHRSIGDAARAADEHDKVLERVREGDAYGAEAAMEEHIHGVWDFYRSVLLRELDGQNPISQAG